MHNLDVRNFGSSLQEWLNRYEFMPIDEFTIQKIRSEIERDLFSQVHPPEFQFVKIYVLQDKEDISRLKIGPVNLFTAMLMNHDYVPFYRVEKYKIYHTKRGMYEWIDPINWEKCSEEEKFGYCRFTPHEDLHG